MPTLTLRANNDRRIEFLPERRGGRVNIDVESERTIRAYIVDLDGLDEFDDREATLFTTLAGDDRAARNHSLSAYIPRDTEWVLLLVNDHDRPSAVHWEFV